MQYADFLGCIERLRALAPHGLLGAPVHQVIDELELIGREMEDSATSIARAYIEKERG